MANSTILGRGFERAQEIADRAVTLLRNKDHLVPLRPAAGTCYLLLAESRSSQEGLAFAQEVRRRAPAAPVLGLDPGMSAQAIEETLGKVSCERFVVAAFASISAYRGTAALAGELPGWLKKSRPRESRWP